MFPNATHNRIILRMRGLLSAALRERGEYATIFPRT
jgi:hypothetical protein